MDPNNNNDSWIKDLYTRTWEQELLISGIAIFGLLSLPQYFPNIKSFVNGLLEHVPLQSFALNFLFSGIYFLIIGFLFHFTLRGFWVGIIGLKSVFTKGIHFDNLNFTEQFVDKLKKSTNDIDSFLIRIDNLCSLVFSYVFLVSAFLFSFFLFIFYLLSLTFFTQKFFNIPISLVSSSIFFIGGLIYAFDFVTGGILKKNKYIYKAFSPLYWFYSTILLSFIYRPVYYIYISNYPKFKFTTFIIISFILAIFAYRIFEPKTHNLSNKNLFSKNLSPHSNSSLFINPKNYANMVSPNEMDNSVIINSDVYKKGDYIKLFLPVSSLDFDFYYNHLDSIMNVSDNKRDSLFLDLISKKTSILINNYPIEQLSFNYTYYPNTKNEGVISYIPTDSLDLGKNILTVLSRKFGILTKETVTFWIKGN